MQKVMAVHDFTSFTEVASFQY